MGSDEYATSATAQYAEGATLGQRSMIGKSTLTGSDARATILGGLHGDIEVSFDRLSRLANNVRDLADRLGAPNNSGAGPVRAADPAKPESGAIHELRRLAQMVAERVDDLESEFARIRDIA